MPALAFVLRLTLCSLHLAVPRLFRSFKPEAQRIVPQGAADKLSER